MSDSDTQGNESAFSQLAHISVIVKDIERSVRYYESLGIGPFITPTRLKQNNIGYVKRMYRGSPAGYIGLIVREARIGPAVLQLVQHIEGACVEKDFLDSKGEGVFHLGFVVDDIDKEEAKAVKLGLNVIQSGRRADGSGNAFFETESLGGVMLEIKQVPAEINEMPEEIKTSEESPFSQLHHVTVVVKDIERAVKFYSSVGLGPLVSPEKHVFANKTLRGKPLTHKLLIRETHIGPAVLQLVQHVEGEDVYKEFIDKRGEGVQHLGFVVDNIDKAEDAAVKMGLKVTQRSRGEDGSGFAYFDTELLGGVVLEIRKEPSE